MHFLYYYFSCRAWKNDTKMGEKLRVSKEEARRLSVKVAEMEADRAAMERQTENDADVTAERVRAAGQRITELQGKQTKRWDGAIAQVCTDGCWCWCCWVPALA